ncbi:MAG: hypothetical protein LJE69_05650 [Thiohalocapsa sp.]|jgi:uncharacterized membrane protein YhaH (DUF805 family)|uniref:DUF805 domain-containing protein n=1 Tax=Thiohalocapsa sp. TaxID=2497641 RepID=UPI0025DA616F|nr:DUF805 domain-containing protein [Thiohalocapsa sp.]MCG6940717.1 hypothetical protein [Thiohalocapsa sp.]
MFRALWGDIQNGRLERLPFLGWYLLVSLLALLLAFGIGAVIGAAERMAGGDPVAHQLSLADSLGTTGVLAVAVVFALLLMAQLNLMAKRARDMGLPVPWLLVLGWLLLSGLVSSGGGAALGGLLSLVVLLALLFVPTGAFGRT